MLKNINYTLQNSKGFSLVEVILASAVFALLVTALTGIYFYGQESTALAGNRSRAVFLAEEGLEVVRNLRDTNFSSLVDGTYGLAISGNQWVFSGFSDLTNIFTRQITITSVDSQRKEIASKVTWQQNQQRDGLVSLKTRLTNWIALSSNNWANAIQEASINMAGNDNGIKVQVLNNYAYIVRDGGNDFAIIDISNPSSPLLVSSLSLDGILSNLFVFGNYAYITSSSDSSELIIVDVSLPASPQVIGTYNDAGNQNARGVFVNGLYAYLALDGGNDFVIVDISTPSSPVFVSGLSLIGNAYEIVISGNYAYIASDANNQELQIIDIFVPTAPILASALDFSGNVDATTIAMVNSNVLVGQGSNLRIANVVTPTAPVNRGSFNVSGTINDIALNFNNNTYAFISTNSNSSEFQIINIADASAPVLLGSVNIAASGNLNGVAYHSGNNRAFAVSESNNEEFIVIKAQ